MSQLQKSEIVSPADKVLGEEAGIQPFQRLLDHRPAFAGVTLFLSFTIGSYISTILRFLEISFENLTKVDLSQILQLNVPIHPPCASGGIIQKPFVIMD
jgi:hypothetical protein